jgi:hypothetical protein
MRGALFLRRGVADRHPIWRKAEPPADQVPQIAVEILEHGLRDNRPRSRPCAKTQTRARPLIANEGVLLRRPGEEEGSGTFAARRGATSTQRWALSSRVSSTRVKPSTPMNQAIPSPQSRMVRARWARDRGVLEFHQFGATLKSWLLTTSASRMRGTSERSL